ncbi:MAG: DUF1835 domain-containing protein [Bacteroidota bacterium]
MIHIVFNEPDIAVLKQAIELDENMQGDVLQIKDDYAVGPMAEIYTEAGRERRKQWWQEVLAGGDYEGTTDAGEVHDDKLVVALVERLQHNPAEIIWIWAAQNKHDVSGYYWLISQLKDYQGRIFILYLNNLPFINEKGNIFYPEWLHVIPPKEFIKAKRLARAITLSEFEIDPDEWTKLCNEDKGVRLLEGGKKLVQQDGDFYDAELLKFITPEWQKASRLIHQYLSKAKHTTGDAYLLWRLKNMVAAGRLDVQGEPKKMKDFEVKSRTANLPETGQSAN